MAHRGGKGADPFSQKRNRFDRFAQMSKQEEMIQQKKREIQAKLEAQKRKEAEDALKKLATSNLNKSGAKKPLSRSTPGSSSRPRGDIKPASPASTAPLNIFSNDGSFMDQFRKLAGVKDGKQSNTSKREDKRSSTSSEGGQHSESLRDFGRDSRDYRDRDSRNSGRDSSRDCRDNYDDRHRDDRHRDDRRHCHDRMSNRSSRNTYDRRSWDQEERQNKPWHTNELPRPSSPYSPTLSPPPTKTDVAFPFPPPSMNLPPPVAPSQQQLTVPSQFSQPPPNQFLPFNPSIPPIPQQQPLTTSVPPPQMNLMMTQPPSIPPPPPPSHDSHLVPPPPAPPNIIPGLLPPHLVQQLSATASQFSSVSAQYPVPQFPPPPAVMSVPPPGGNAGPITDVKPLVSAETGTAVPPPTSSVFCPGLKTEPPDGVPSAVPPPSTGVPPIGPVLGSNLTSLGQALGPAMGPALGPSLGTADLALHGGPDMMSRPGQDVQDEAVKQLAQMVSQCGDDIEEIIKSRNPNDYKLWFLHQKDSEHYKEYRRLVAKYREKAEQGDTADGDKSELIGAIKREREDTERTSGNGFVKSEPTDSREGRGNEAPVAPRKRVRRSRWDPEDTKVTPPALGVPATISPLLPPTNVPPPVLPPSNIPPPIAGLSAGQAPLLSRVNRTDPALLRYAIQAFGTSNLSEDDWKKAEDHYKINLLYQDMLKKRAELEKLQQQGKFKYEYDSDEETEGGTWEHKLRAAEMEATERWADELTLKAQGKHHIGDFLPPDELARFMEKYSALKEDREPDLSDYKEFKLKEDNIGFQMLQKLGWTEGQGLGVDGSGIVDPVNKANRGLDNQGLGIDRPDEVSKGDDEFEAYRKRMMLAYRFRPNPLNNPRRPYY